MNMQAVARTKGLLSALLTVAVGVLVGVAVGGGTAPAARSNPEFIAREGPGPSLGHIPTQRSATPDS